MTAFEAKMDEAGLPETRRRWMQFCLINSYVLLRACYEFAEDDAALFQVAVVLNVMTLIIAFVASFVFQM